jgi:hypothetical protein
LELVNLFYSGKLSRISVHFDRILTESGFWATSFGMLLAEGVTPAALAYGSNGG